MQQTINYSSSIEFYLALCLMLPLLSFVLSFLISDRYAWAISFTAPFLQLASAFCAVVIFLRASGHTYNIPLDWFHIGTLKFTANLQVNKFSMVMLPVVTIISFLVHLYSTGYMAGISGNRKYFALLSFFTFSMLGIVLANDLLLVFVFWELVGFCSYILIGHYTEKPEAASAAKKAFLFNRIGDIGFLAGLMIIWSNVGTFDLNVVLTTKGGDWMTAASLCIFCGVIGKSAQFPLFNWLPDAMIGPTPVSALIHAATMVAAGVFMLVRLHPLFTDVSMTVFAFTGITTALMAALSALAQTDIKKILAYSTISQLGFMIAAIGAGVPESAMLHLVTHAFFKACLFLSAGSVIHVLHQAQQQSHHHFDVQDIRNLGGLRKKLPFTFAAFVVSGCALAGVPLFSGFLSKESILSVISINAEHGAVYGWPILALMFVVSFLTVLYTFRMIWLVFMGNEKMTENLTFTEAPMVMRMPLALLMTASTWLIVSLNPFDYYGWLVDQIYSPSFRVGFHNVTFVSAAWVIFALVTAYFFYRRNNITYPAKLLLNAFHLDIVYNRIFAKSALAVSAATSAIDSKWIDGIIHAGAYVNVTASHLISWFDKAIVDGTVHAFAATARGVGSFARSFQGGKIQLYIFLATLGLIIFIIWILVQ